MVNEREPARPSGYFTKDNGKTPRSSSHGVPEFGKPSPLGQANVNRSSNPFVIPKANKPRPEHHRPSMHSSQSYDSHNSTSTSRPGSPSHKHPSQSIHPLHPVKPATYNTFPANPITLDDDDDSVVEIFKPANTTWTTKPAPTPLFSSKPSGPKPPKPSNNLKNFVDLTTNYVGSQINENHHREEFGAMDAYSYVDVAKANENIKALLEGAFEDEDDKPRTRSRKKKLVEDQMNDLAAKLGAVNVSDMPEEKVEAEGSAEEEEEEDDGTVEGLKVKLLPHQIDGVNWMADKETGTKKTRGVLPKGGILADDMGLGKTIQSIALLLTNPRPAESKSTSDDDKKKNKFKLSADVGKGTLIIAPLALIKQWESEIDTKVEDSHRMRVCIYHGAGRTKHAQDLKKYDVVITTYGTLSSEHASTTKGTTKVGCYTHHWYRIILDEAHTIKNRNAKSTQAVYALDSEYRWCLTGTPMQNNLDELQSLIKFLRIKPYDDLAAWRDQITRPLNNGRGGLAIRRLQVYLKAFMKRRTKDVLKLDGGLNGSDPANKEGETKSSNGFQITKREVLNIEAEFTPPEREFYKRLETRTDKSLEQMMGGSKLNYASALVLLLRLRQACNHPDLVKGDLAKEKEVLTGNLGGSQSKSTSNEDVDGIADLFGGLSVVTKRCDVCQIELSKKEAMDGASRCVECEADLDARPLKKSKKEKKKKKKKSKKVNSSQESSDAQRARARRNRPVVIDSDDEDEAEWIVPEEQRVHSELGKAGGTDDEDAEGGGEWLNSGDSETDENEDTSDEDDETEEEDESDEDVGYGRSDVEHLASTKVRRLMNILRKESADFKFIVFSFFTSMLDKIEPFLEEANIGYARYDGAMRNDLRENSLDRLRNSKKTRVLLCSLRAGSLGLNLTAASRVVILEPFWNPFVEEQAIDRVHRLNQTVDVKVYKMTIKDTVEARILDLQERKRELANATIEGKAAASKLTMNDMMALFGHDAESRFDYGGHGLDLGGRTRLLESKNEDEAYGSSFWDGGISGLSSKSSSFSQQSSRRTTPPIMERGSGSRPKPVESSIYGRRW